MSLNKSQFVLSVLDIVSSVVCKCICVRVGGQMETRIRNVRGSMVSVLNELISHEENH